MNQEKKNSIKWIATFLAIIVLFAGVGAALGLVIQQMKQNNTDTPIASGDGKDMFEGQIYEMPSVLAFSADATTAADSGHTASVTLTATVLPVEATNKLVDWSVAWGVTKQHGSENVTDYVTVTPKSDGTLDQKLTIIYYLVEFKEKTKLKLDKSDTRDSRALSQMF